MGVHRNITATKFPEQGKLLKQRVRVCFHYDVVESIMGTVVRDDNQDPCVMIIKLDDGRYVLSTECQYHVGTAV